uniref:CPG4 domain-containing protein n=1 Tax=Elaeophora elaphi TaxID=1147741 RepID=A0A0R3RPU4_9BILA
MISYVCSKKYYFLMNHTGTRSILCVEGFLSGDCVEPCISEMQLIMENTPFSRSDHQGQLSWTQLLQASKNRRVTENSFHSICEAYKRVDKCLEECEKTSEHSASIRRTYAGLRFICVEQKEEFFNNLPCLAQYEPVAMSRCQNEINQSLVGSNLFSAAVINREQHNIQNRLGTLCRDLANMIKCIEPVTRSGCGEAAAKMMLKFITVGFTSFEQLYNHLGITDQLPHSCRQLLNLTIESRINNERWLIFSSSQSRNSYPGNVMDSDSACQVIPSITFLLLSISFCYS